MEPHEVDWRDDISDPPWSRVPGPAGGAQGFACQLSRVGTEEPVELVGLELKKSAMRNHASMTDGSFAGDGGAFAKQLAATGRSAIWDGRGSVVVQWQDWLIIPGQARRWQGRHDRQVAITLDTVVRSSRTSGVHGGVQQRHGQDRHRSATRRS